MTRFKTEQEFKDSGCRLVKDCDDSRTLDYYTDDKSDYVVYKRHWGKPISESTAQHWIEPWMTAEELNIDREWVESFQLEKEQVEKPEHMLKPWHLYEINDGAEIRYINDKGYSIEIPLLEDYSYHQHSDNLELLEYIVSLHNKHIMK